MAPTAWQKSPLALTVTAATMALMLGVPQEMYLPWLRYILIYPDDLYFDLKIDILSVQLRLDFCDFVAESSYKVHSRARGLSRTVENENHI
jgi:hypothetical protein